MDRVTRVISQSDVKRRWDEYMSDIIINDNDPTITTGSGIKLAFLFEDWSNQVLH